MWPVASILFAGMIAVISGEDPIAICEEDTACTCIDGIVNCTQVFWTEDEEGERIHEPLNTTNLKFDDKGGKFQAKKAIFRDNSIVKLEKGKILPGQEKYIEELDFTFNRISIIGKAAFKGMEELRILRLGYNKLETLKSESFEGGLDWKLHQLYLEYNILTNLPSKLFDSLPQLEKLVLDGNRELNLSRKLFGEELSNLKKLSLDDCNIKDLEDDIFDNLDSLEELSLRNNPLTEIPKALNDIPSLIALDLSGTQITEIQSNTFSNCKKLETLRLLDLKYMYIIHDCAFCGLRSLKTLVMSNATELYEIHPGAFGFGKDEEVVPAITEFNVEFANLSSLSAKMLDFRKVEKIVLGGNPWNCSCSMAWVIEYSLDLNQGIKTPMCSIPKGLAGRRLNELTGQDVCPSRARIRRLFISFFVLLTVVIIVVLLNYFIRNYRIRNVFYRPDLPHIGYSNLNRVEDDEQNKGDQQANSHPAEV